MQLTQYIVDAFVCGPFSGNPAAVCPLEEWISEELMQNVAAENNLSETAFFVLRDEERNKLRWFTPTTEVDLCGHATLATAHVLAREMNVLSDGGDLAFDTRGGVLTVEKAVDGYSLRMPAAIPVPTEPPDGLMEALGQGSGDVFRTGDDLMVVFDDAGRIEACSPDFDTIRDLDARCVYVCAASDDGTHDYVVRVFGPAVGIDEDPATGSAQCGLGPYWAERLGQSPVRCRQASRRGGELVAGWRSGETEVVVSGRCATFSRAEIELPS